MEFRGYVYLFVQAVQIIGTLVPVIGIFVLINKEYSKTSMHLMIANIGCLIMNGTYFLLLRAESDAEAKLALKIEYLGNAMFFLFFINFILSYLKTWQKHNLLKIFNGIWLVYECVIIMFLWGGNKNGMIYSKIDFSNDEMAGFHYLSTVMGDLSKIRYCALTMFMIALLGYMIRCLLAIRKRKGIGRKSLSYVIAAQAVIIGSFIMAELSWVLPYFDIVPICASAAVFVIIVCVIRGDMLLVTDIGRGWVFDNINSIFIIVNSEYCFLDANVCAKKFFPDLSDLQKGDSVSETVYNLFLTGSGEIRIDGHYFERTVTPLKQNGKIKDWCVILRDMTQQRAMMEELKEAKRRAEEANESKSNFLSNMSHEIRTPMNAIVGMTEILLRSEQGGQERGYLVNIKNSSAALLNIINDILDFSKIESGKLEIIEEDYEPMSMLNDLGIIFLTRIGEKPVELLFDIDKDMPQKLCGDSLRIRQVIINIVNNAIKFTESGYVKLAIWLTPINDGEMVDFAVSVRDTGQGIRQEDMDKLFGSFQQVDTKKNRNKEGTGLGLSISRQLVELMGGQIGVKSEYGKGSTFYFHIPQKVIGENKAAQCAERAVIGGFMENEIVLDQLKKIAQDYGIDYANGSAQCVDFFFMDVSVYQKWRAGERLDCIIPESARICVLQNPLQEDVPDDGVIVVNKPLYTMNFCQVINHEDVGVMETNDGMDFTAPNADILIVDDNEMNLKVARGLLQPLEMRIDTADSGKRAIDMVQKKHYDIVFMDHMMPVMDGVETTRYIRNLSDEYLSKVPIIALTANAMAGAKDIFLEAGMNDFIPKPIELKTICAKIRKWLPDGLVQRYQSAKADQSGDKTWDELPVIEGIDTAEGVKNSGSPELFMNLLGDFYKLIDIKAAKIEKCLADGMIHDYTIEVHGLKNTARMIGAMQLSELFYKMEQCGNAQDIETIVRENPAVMELYRSYKPVLEPYGRANEQEKRAVPRSEIIEALENLIHAMDGFDLDGADGALAILEEYRMPGELVPCMKLLRAYVADVNMEETIALGNQMIKLLVLHPDRN